MDTTYSHDYKCSTIDIIVEDDRITTAKIITDGDVQMFDCGGDEGLPNNRKSVDTVLNFCKGKVDEYLDFCVASIR